MRWLSHLRWQAQAQGAPPSTAFRRSPSPVARATGEDRAGYPPRTRLPPLGQHVAIARDDAFAFLYSHWLEDWRAAGADLSFFSPLLDEAPTPAVGRLARDPQVGRDLRIRSPRGTGQDDLRPLRQRLRRGPSPGPLLQPRTLAGTHGHSNGRASSFRRPRLLVPEVREARRIRFRTSDPGH